MISERQLHQKRAFDDEEKFQIITNIVLITHIYYSKYLLIERTTLSTSVQLKKKPERKRANNATKFDYPESCCYSSLI